jgi:hypothetical protein
MMKGRRRKRAYFVSIDKAGFRFMYYLDGAGRLNNPTLKLHKVLPIPRPEAPAVWLASDDVRSEVPNGFADVDRGELT